MQNENSPIIIWLGKKLKRHRNLKGLCQMGLAELAEMDLTYYGAVERGEKGISVQKLSNISKALQVSLSELFLDEPENFSIDKEGSEKDNQIEKIISSLRQFDFDELSLVYDLLARASKWKANK